MKWQACYTLCMFDYLESLLLSYAAVLPLPFFAAVASFAEEIIAPIPSGPVMLVMGSLAKVQGYSLWMLFALAIAAAIGKLAGGLVVYAVADKAEDVLLGRFARFFGVTHAQIESFGARLGNGWRDYLLLTLLRTLPFVPSVVVSFGAGALRIRLRLFVVATIIGSVLRDSFFLYLGYAGLPFAEDLLARFSTIESFLQGAIVLGVVIAAGILAYVHTKGRKR